MTLDHPEFTSLVSDEAIADLAATAEAIQAAMDSVRAMHNGYRFTNPNEIRCNARSCSRFLSVKVGVDSPGAVYAGHQSDELDALLAASSTETAG